MTTNGKFRTTCVNMRRAPTDMINNEVRTLNALGALSSINPGNRNHPVPLPTNYLHQTSQLPGLQMGHSQIAPPPLPPRPNQTLHSTFNRYPGMNSYSNYYSPMSPFSSGLYSPYGYRAPYSRFGAPPEPNSFVQLAEESSRPAFESIESVVQVVSSISMMLESTYHAVHSSYSAILGVVDQFSRLKEHLAQVLSFLALLRGLRWLCLKLLYLLKLRKDNPAVESAWRSAENVAGSSDSVGLGDDSRSPWPFFIFLSLAIGAPWLMFKLLTKNIKKKPHDIRLWSDENGRYFSVVAAYDFTHPRPGELALTAGEKLYIAPANLQCNTPKGWLLACNMKNETGLIPSNYLIRNAVKKKYLRHNGPALVPAHGNISYSSADLANYETDIGVPTNQFPLHEATQRDISEPETAQEDILQSETTQESPFIVGRPTEPFSQPNATESFPQNKTIDETLSKTDARQEVISQLNPVQETNVVPSKTESKCVNDDIECEEKKDC